MKFRKHIVPVMLSAVLVSVFCYAVASLSTPGERLYEFFFSRSFIQFITLYVFTFTTWLLCDRAVFHVRIKAQLRHVYKNKENRHTRPGPLSRQVSDVRRILRESGGAAARSFAENSAKAEKEKTHKSYEAIHFLVCSLPALGLFGTMLGLSHSLFTAFSGSSGGMEGIQKFVTALATALDTTVLALACAMLAGGLAWFMERSEHKISGQQARFIREAFSLENFAVESENSKPDGFADNHLPAATEAFRAELRSLTAEIVEDARNKFTSMLHNSSEYFRSEIGQAVKDVLEEQRMHEQKLLDRVAVRLGESIDQVGCLIEHHNGRTAQDMNSQLKKVVKLLNKRFPNEVVIRYEGDGYPAREAE